MSAREPARTPSPLPTTYDLTVADERIRVRSELAQVDFVPLNDVNAFQELAGID